jgi:hypothetical protein
MLLKKTSERGKFTSRLYLVLKIDRSESIDLVITYTQQPEGNECK